MPLTGTLLSDPNDDFPHIRDTANQQIIPLIFRAQMETLAALTHQPLEENRTYTSLDNDFPSVMFRAAEAAYRDFGMDNVFNGSPATVNGFFVQLGLQANHPFVKAWQIRSYLVVVDFSL